jgi:CheY-like chemotaxis protein
MIDITARLQSRRQAASPSPAQTSTHLAHEPEKASGPLVLVVEDHAATQNVLHSVLNLQGYQVVCTANGREALEWLEKAFQTKLRPALILLDLFMPVMNGVDFLVSMRANWPDAESETPVLLFTVDQGNYDELGCEEVLLKPFHIRDLLARIESILGRQQRMHLH